MWRWLFFSLYPTGKHQVHEFESNYESWRSNIKITRLLAIKCISLKDSESMRAGGQTSIKLTRLLAMRVWCVVLDSPVILGTAFCCAFWQQTYPRSR